MSNNITVAEKQQETLTLVDDSEILSNKEPRHPDSPKAYNKKQCCRTNESEGDERGISVPMVAQGEIVLAESEIDDAEQWTFLDSVPEIMECRICYNVFESPQLLTCCSSNICKKCIENHLQRETLL